jgi:hypothetical protein
MNGMPVALGLGPEGVERRVRPAQDVVPLHRHPVGDVAHRRHDPDLGLRRGVGEPYDSPRAHRVWLAAQGCASGQAAAKQLASEQHQLVS